MITVSALHVYPLKGGRGLAPQRWPVDERGLRHDRRFMLVDDDGRFISQRSHAKLALVGATIEGDSLRLSCGAAHADVPLAPRDGERIAATVWDDSLDAVLVSRDADAMLSAFLEFSCRLVWMPDDAPRLTAPKRGAQRHVSFADAAPLLVVAEEALAELNQRIADASNDVPVNRFRPNIVVRGAPSGDDDAWSALAIGPTRLRLSNACRRCQVITIDQTTAEHRGPEPLRTLATYRREDDAVTFGQHALVDAPGTIEIGDVVEVLARSR